VTCIKRNMTPERAMRTTSSRQSFATTASTNSQARHSFIALQTQRGSAASVLFLITYFLSFLEPACCSPPACFTRATRLPPQPGLRCPPTPTIHNKQQAGDTANHASRPILQNQLNPHRSPNIVIRLIALSFLQASTFALFYSRTSAFSAACIATAYSRAPLHSYILDRPSKNLRFC
jgi:hypothetical protein